MAFSKKALRQSLNNIPVPSAEAVLPDTALGKKYSKRGLSAGAYAVRIIPVAAALCIIAAVAVGLKGLETGDIGSIGSDGNTMSTVPEGSYAANLPLITADTFDKYAVKNDSTGSDATTDNSNAEATETDEYNCSEGSDGTTTANNTSAGGGDKISDMLSQKLAEYRGENVYFRVVVEYFTADIEAELEYADNLGSRNIKKLPQISGYNVNGSNYIMELTEDMIYKIADKSGVKIYLAATDDLYTE